MPKGNRDRIYAGNWAEDTGDWKATHYCFDGWLDNPYVPSGRVKVSMDAIVMVVSTIRARLLVVQKQAKNQDCEGRWIPK